MHSCRARTSAVCDSSVETVACCHLAFSDAGRVSCCDEQVRNDQAKTGRSIVPLGVDGIPRQIGVTRHQTLEVEHLQTGLRW